MSGNKSCIKVMATIFNSKEFLRAEINDGLSRRKFLGN
jgi:hypothetical protein